MKSEPGDYSIQDLQREKQTIWDGVRNYQARNFLRRMRKNDLAFFYHSNTKSPGIVGLMRVAQSDVLDPTQFDENSRYYDARSVPENPRWQTVNVEFIEKFPAMVSLAQLKSEFDGDQILVVRKGNRLSVMPIAEDIAQKILAISHNQPAKTN